jgi:hypothetical protein
LFCFLLIKNYWQQPIRFYQATEINIASTINKQTNPDDKVYLLGLPSSLYVLSNRLPSTPWFDNYGWYFEVAGVQEDTIKRWERDKPKFIYWQTSLRGNWFDIGVYQPESIVEWIKQNYTNIGNLQDNIFIWQQKI